MRGVLPGSLRHLHGSRRPRRVADRLVAALRGNQDDTDQFIGVIAGTVPIASAANATRSERWRPPVLIELLPAAVTRYWAVMGIVPPPSQDQVPRLQAFRAEHPDIEIASPADSRTGMWAA